MSGSVTDTLKKEELLSSGVIELKKNGNWMQLAGFTDLVLSSEPFVKESSPTDDGIAGVKTVRQDGKAAFNLRMPKSIVLIEDLFSVPVDYTLATVEAVAAEVNKVGLKAGDGIYEALLQFPSGDGSDNTLITVNGEGGSPTYILDTDYTIENVNGFTAIRMLSAGAIVKDQVVEVDYSYLPLTSATATLGEAINLPAKEFRFREAPDTAGSSVTDNLMTIEFTCADVVSGLNYGFPDMAGENDEIEMPVEIDNRTGEPFFVTMSARA